MDTITPHIYHLSKCLTNTKSPKQILMVHQKIVSLGLLNHTVLFKNLVNLYISIGSYQMLLWNGLIAAYTKRSMFSEAFSVFGRLLQHARLKPDSHTYPSLLKAFGGLRRLDYGSMIHTRLIKSGFISDVVIASSLTSTYAKCGLFCLAAKVFDEMPHRDVACWNNVISCHYQSGQWEKALECFDRMKRTGLNPDSVSFATAISACGRLSDVEKGRKLHEEVSSGGVAMDSYVGSALVDMYGKCGCLEKAEEIFEEIEGKSLVCWNSMIGGYSRIGDSASSIAILARMSRAGVKPSSTTASTLLAACAKSVRSMHGRFVHGYIVRNNLSTDHFFECSLLDFYFKCGHIAVAEKIFTAMPKGPKSDIITWNVMISGYVSLGTYVKALGMYESMQAKGVKPDVITLTSVLSACSQLTALERGRELHKHIDENHFGSNEVVMGALLDMYAKCGAVDEAVTVFNRLAKKDLVSWTSMIVAHGSHGQASKTMDLFDEMLSENIEPDRVVFLAVISACSHAGLVDEGRSYFYRMVDEYGIEPTAAEYSCLVDLLCRAGRLREAYGILEKDSRIEGNAEILSTIFAACHLRGEFNLGEKVGRALVEKGSGDVSTYVVLEKMYAAEGKWAEASKIRVKMKEMGLKKSPGCSWIEVDNGIRSFLAADKACVEAEHVYDCLSLMYGHLERDAIAMESRISFR